MIHDEQDFEQKIKCYLLVLWGNEGFVHRTYDVLKTWKEKAQHVQGKALNSGHFLAEENPEETLSELNNFFND
jgi:haloacetate dehalogenase